MIPRAFIAKHPVFRFDEFAAEYRNSSDRSPRTIGAILNHHVTTGRLINIRRGLYGTIPEGVRTDFQIDPYLIASRLAADAVVAYHSALELLGKAHSVASRMTFLTKQRMRPFSFQGILYTPVLAPKTVRFLPDFGGGLKSESRGGISLRVTGYERTLVDVLNAPEYGGGWEEIWRSLESIEFFDLELVINYALQLKSALTIARVGFFLEQHRGPLMVEEEHLEKLRAAAPKQRQYFERRHRKGGTLVPRWNLIVPKDVLERSWEEVA